VYLTGWGTISVHTERPQISDARQKKNELIFKLLAHFQNTELKVKKKKVLSLYSLQKLETLGKNL